MYHIAATLGMTVDELGEKLLWTEYLGWIEYFNAQKPEPEQPNMLDSSETMLKGFGF